MPAIKYKDGNGQWQLLNNVMVNQINVVQTSGTSIDDVISQSGVTNIVGGVNDVLTAHTTDSTVHFTTGAVQTLIDDSISGKTDTSDFTAHTSDTTVHFTTGTVQTQIDNSISGKVNTSDVISAITSANSASTNPVSVSGIMTVIKENEEVTSAALNDLNGAITDIDEVISGHTADTSIHLTSTEKTNLDSLATNIAAISGVSSTKVSNWDTAYTNNHTHSNKTYLDGITGSVGTMAYQNTSSYSSATEVNTALGNKANTATTIAGYGITDAKIENQVITLGSDSITVSSATQVNTALGYKADKADAVVSAVTVSSDLSNVTCPDSITGASKSGAQAIVIYENGGTTTDYTITVSTSYKSPDGSQISITCAKGGYCEVSYINVNGTIYARGA